MDARRWLLNAALLIALGAGAARAEPAGPELSFAEIWKRASSHAPELAAADHELEAARINEKRQSRHWYPRVFAEARAFATNDPATSFMSLLGQRQIAAPDFAPSALNHPGDNFYEHATLGVDFPLYEGGAKVAAAEGSRKQTEARSWERKSAEIGEYADLAGSYASILALQAQRRQLAGLASAVDEILARYKIGARANPVGYSGLLGLKNLRNRLEGLLVENAARGEGLRERLRVMAGGLPEGWSPRSEDPEKFLKSNLSPRASAGEASSVRALQASAEALDKSKDAERARFLPKVGLFGTGDVYGGSRSTASSYTAGAYLQWDLLSVTSFGAVGQAEHTAAAAQARADGAAERSAIEQAGARQQADGLERSLALMDQSSKYLEEQTITARGLFRNGSITALQLVEVLARRADLLASRTEAQLALAQARATLVVSSGMEGVPHE